MKKRLVTVIASMLLVILACFSLVACGAKGVEGTWRCDVKSPKEYIYIQIESGKMKRFETVGGSSVEERRYTLFPVDDRENCYRYDDGYIVLAEDDQLLFGNSPDIDGSSAKFVFTRTKLSFNDWLKEIATGW